MRRLLMMIPVAAQAVVGFAPAQAANPPERIPIVVGCTGTAGYEDTPDGPRWEAEEASDPIAHRKLCGVHSLDTAPPFNPQPPPTTGWLDWLLFKTLLPTASNRCRTSSS